MTSFIQNLSKLYLCYLHTLQLCQKCVKKAFEVHFYINNKSDVIVIYQIGLSLNSQWLSDSVIIEAKTGHLPNV